MTVADLPQAVPVTLVIDDGPSDVTGAMLDQLERAGHRAVLFVLGRHIAGREAVLVDAVRRGFALGNHSFSHPRFSGIDVETARDEIVRTDALIDDVYARAGVKRPGRWFRFPYLDTGDQRAPAFQALLAELGFGIPQALQGQLPEWERARCDWPSTLVTRDWALPPVDEFRDTVGRAVADDVVEYHDSVDTVTRLCEPLLDVLEHRGLRAALPPRDVRRVFLVSWWMDRIGGMERHIAELATSLQRRGVEVSYFSEMPLPRDNAYRQRMEAGRVRVHAPPRALEWANRWRRKACQVPWLNRLLGGASPSDPFTQGDLLSQWLIRAMAHEAPDAPPDVVHVHGVRLGQSWTLAWARSRGWPTMYSEHVAIGESGGPWHPHDPATVSQSAGVVATVSTHSRASLQETLPGSHRIVVTNHIVPEPAPPADGVDPSPFTWGSVARLDTYKGVDLLLDAFARCVRQDARYRLVLAGDGPKRAELEAQARALGIAEHVEFRGKVAPDDVSPLLHSLGGFVLASRTEGLPVALVEALAHGKPIVSSEAGGIPELLGNSQAALLVPIGDPVALALAVMRVTTDEGVRERMMRAAREEFRASRYHEQAVFYDMLGHYRAARDAS